MKAMIHQHLLNVMEKIDRPGTFCTSGRLPATLPGLEVAGIGTIGLPLEKHQAAALKKLARQAPYGKGTRTLVDTRVRRVWEMDASQIALANSQWSEVVSQAIETVQAELGLENQNLQAHLYKLLLYERGSFFLAHRDGEKLDRMVGTLVIALPSFHQGGELVVRHEGREEVIDFGLQSRFQTQFAAFYADCEHEVRPVTSGFRLALVYNLTLAESKSSIAAPTSGQHIAEAIRLLGQWSGQGRAASPANDGVDGSKLAVILDHEYTQAGLTRDALKGIDRARSDVLFAAARESGCDAALALVTYWESGSAEPSGDDYGYGRRRRYGYRDDAFDGKQGDGQAIMGEVFDRSLTAEHFTDAQGVSLSYGRIPLKDEELVSSSPVNEDEPDEEDFEGYTGNAGMTLERWYHRAAVVLWPAESRFAVLCEAGIAAAVGGLEQMVGRWKQALKGERENLNQSCLEFARQIIVHWPEQPFASGYRPVSVHAEDDTDEDEFDQNEDFDDDDDELREMNDEHRGPTESSGLQKDGDARSASPRPLLSLLNDLRDASLISAWIRNVLGKDINVDPRETLGNACHRHGWATFKGELLELFDNTSNESLERHARLLADWSLRQDEDADRKGLCSQLAGRIMSAVERWDARQAPHDWRARDIHPGELLPPLIQAFLALDEPKLLDRLVTYVLDPPKEFDLTTVQVPALVGLEKWLKRNVKLASSALRRWLLSISQELENRQAHPPREPADSRRESVTGCNCADCKELSRFLDDPDRSTLRLPLAEQRRRHLHGIIDGKKLDVTDVTERRGRPYTLVCTKTKASYERALQAYRVDVDQLAKMQKLLDWHNRLNAGIARPET